MIPQIAPTGLRHRISSESIRPPSWKDGRTEICACKYQQRRRRLAKGGSDAK